MTHLLSRRATTLAAALGLWSAHVEAQGTWTPLPQAAQPSPRQSSRMMAYDAAADRIVLFGGSPPNGVYLGDTHVFDCASSTWTQITGGPSPSPRYGHTMTYDAARNEVILFGGRLVNGNGTFSNETWAFNGTSWQQRMPVNAPPPRYLHAAVYDSARAVIVVFGGGGPPATTSDTWEWNGTNWNLRATTIPSPNPLRSNSAIAYDPIRQRTVIFGGRTSSAFFGGTLEWDGNTWTNVTPPGTSPPNRAAAAMVYDASLDRVVLFNGNTAAGTLSDTWYWDGATWTPVFPGTPPAQRCNSGFVFDSLRERCVLFGGNSSIAHHDDLWSFAPATPARLQPFGQGCVGAPYVPTLAAADHRRPWLGDTYALTIGGLPSSGLYALVTGLSNQSWNGLPLPLPLAGLGMPACDAWVSLDDLRVGVHFGTAVVPITLLNLPAAAGLSFFHQALVFYPGVNAFGALVSDGVEAVLGLR